MPGRSPKTEQLNDASVLVTGGAGFIGSHLVDALASIKPERLVVADSFFLGKRENLEFAQGRFPGLVVEEIDVSDYVTIESLLRRHSIEVVFDLATIPLPYSLVEPVDTIRQNVGMARNLAELARLGVFQTLIHFSTSEVYGTAQSIPMTEDHPMKPLTPYAASKAAADHIIMSYRSTFGIDVTIVRPFNTYGPRQNERSYAGLIPTVVKRTMAGAPIQVHGDGNQTRDFLFVGDVVKATLAAYANEGTRGRIVNVASSREASVNEVVASLLQALGSSVSVEHVADRPGDVRRHCGSHALATELFGFEPSVSLQDGLATTAEWYRQSLSEAT